MAQGQLGSLLRHIRRLIGGAPAADVPDGQLLEQFRLQRDEAAFTALVQRHGPLVLGVCRRMLRDSHEAEDAFQATFLVLARKAGAIRKPEALSSWLHGVAARVAVRARNQGLQRRARESQVMAMASNNGTHQTLEPAADQPGPLAESAQRELRLVLDEELARLPEKYRQPMVLCYLEGKSNEEAAQQLHWTKGTVSGRLARARDLLRERLSRRGLALSAGGLAVALTENAAPAAVAPSLVEGTVKGACLFSAGAGAAAAEGSSVTALALAQSVLHAMTLAKLKMAAAAVALLALTGSAAGVLAYRGLGDSATQGSAVSSRSASQPSAEDTPAAPANTDPARFARAAVVLRIQRHGQPSLADHHRWDNVAILEVLKNTSTHSFDKTLMIASLEAKHGVPAEACTVYLEPYKPAEPRDHHWKLLDGGAPEGVSHIAPSAGKHGHGQ